MDYGKPSSDIFISCFLIMAANITQPMLWSMYWLNYLDRNAIALARLNTLEEDLNLSGTRE